MTNQSYPIKLRLPSKELVPVTLDCVSQANLVCIILRSENGLYFELLGFQRDLYPILLKWAKIANPESNYRDKIDELSPSQVVAYFEASPVLSYLADDVRAALLSPEEEKASQVSQDVAKVAHLVDPSLADIAQVLTGERQYGGATYHRVKAVQRALKTTTTQPEEGEYWQEAA